MVAVTIVAAGAFGTLIAACCITSALYNRGEL